MNKISKKIFIFVFLGLLSSVVLLIIFQINSYQNELNILSKNRLEITEKLFVDILSNETQILTLALDFLLDDKTAKEYFMKQNIDSLFNYSEPIFEKIKKQYSITHLYYIMPEPNKTCFLRVHNRTKNNDLITRFTFQNAVETKTTASGLELGKTAFALRVVKPYYDDNQNLIGYMEVGQEIDHFFEKIRENTGDDFFVLVNKKYIDQQKWNTARETNSKMSSWEEFENEVNITSTSTEISLSKINLHNIPNESSVIDKQFKINDKVYVLSQIPLIDAGNRKVGAIYSTYDITTIRNKMINNIIQILLIFLLFIVIFGIVTVIFIRKTISNPIKKVVNAMKKIADKNIDFRIEEKRNDEIGELYNSTNKIILNLRAIISNINDSAIAISDASNQLSFTSQDVASSTNEQASTTEEIAASIEQILAIINSNTQNAELTGKTTTKSANEMKQSKELFMQTIESVSEISKKISVISEIADKTDILSINAAIEAARAGEAGKGFAVVANEIRKLADKTKISSDAITNLSKKEQDISKIAGEKLENTIPQIIKSAELVNNIISAGKKQQNGVENISISIQQLTEITNGNSASAEEMSVSAEQLSAQAEQLKKLISVFKINNSQNKLSDKI